MRRFRPRLPLLLGCLVFLQSAGSSLSFLFIRASGQIAENAPGTSGVGVGLGVLVFGSGDLDRDRDSAGFGEGLRVSEATNELDRFSISSGWVAGWGVTGRGDLRDQKKMESDHIKGCVMI